MSYYSYPRDLPALHVAKNAEASYIDLRQTGNVLSVEVERRKTEN